jgi:DNA-binding response OmpR family regulator
MENKINLLIYEKETKLNLILMEQISKSGICETYACTNEKRIVELFERIRFSILILNLNDLTVELRNTIQNYNTKNKISYIFSYYDENYHFLSINDIKTKTIKKPFKIVNFIKELQYLINSNFFEKKDVFLMSHLKFLPFERLLYNLKNNNKERLTEKENKLLFYFYKNKNVEITKNDLLTKVWGLSESVNTHTLETHVYRLKQKLNKIEPNLSFSLSNQNGLYLMHFNTTISS